MSDFVQATRQHVLQEPPQELQHRQCHLPVALFSTTPVRECHCVVMEADVPGVSNRRAEHIAAQVLQRGDTVTDRLHIADELATELSSRRNVVQLRSQQSLELRPEQLRQHFHRHEEPRACRAPLTIFQPAAGPALAGCMRAAARI